MCLGRYLAAELLRRCRPEYRSSAENQSRVQAENQNRVALQAR